MELTRLIESCGKHWVSEVEVSRPIQWQGRWRRMGEVAAELSHHHPESFREVEVSCRNGEEIVHEREDLTDAPRFLLTDALHWEGGRVIQTWSYRWVSEVFKAFGSGRQFAAWLGLTPRQYSSGRKTKLGRISKRGDVYLRTLLIHGARAVLRLTDKRTDRKSRWALLARGTEYRLAI